jgi:acetyltransferase-like isoleucine patch superfamily enzyme
MKFNNTNIQISRSARIGKNVKIGDNTIIYDNVEIADNAIIANDCVIGEPINDYYYDDSYSNPVLKIGPGSLIRSHCIIYAGSTIGAHFSTGHRVTIRENTTIGTHCSVGTLSDIQGEVTIGNYCHFHSNVHISQQSKIGNFVFMYPYCVITNDPFPPSDDLKGSVIGDYSQIGVHSVILPGIKIGENCLIGANSLVTRSVKDFSLVSGEPAKTITDVRKLMRIGQKGSHYPWMYNFDRNMPWAGIGYDKWKELQDK